MKELINRPAINTPIINSKIRFDNTGIDPITIGKLKSGSFLTIS